MTRQDIAVIGAGAKGAALAAKASCIRAEGIGDVRVTLFERMGVGAHWDGRHGYTDGAQFLCTPAERDLGFPYDIDSFGGGVATLMQACFSWTSHLIREEALGEWVNRGRPRPTHAAFAAYLRDAVEASEAKVVAAEVVGLRKVGDLWEVQTENPRGERTWHGGFAGVVVTSPGPQRRRFTLDDARVLDGVAFWRSLPEVRKMVAGAEDRPVVILGSGGTAAAVAAWLVRNGGRTPTFGW